MLTGVIGEEMCHWYKCQSLDMIFGVLCGDTLPPYPEEESGHYSPSTPSNAGQGVSARLSTVQLIVNKPVKIFWTTQNLNLKHRKGQVFFFSPDSKQAVFVCLYCFYHAENSIFSYF